MKNIIQRMQDVRTSYALLNGVALVTNGCGLTRKYWRLLLFSFICIEPVAGSFAFSAAEKYSEECGGVTYSYWIVGQNAIINKVVGDLPKISIPSMLGGCRVTEIEAQAFYKNSAEIIIVPDGVTKIETCAFDSCPNLIQLRIPGTVEKCELITKNCLNLEEVSVPDREPDVRFSLLSLFGYDNQYKKLRRVEISDGATTLFNYSFMGCTSVEKICFPVTLRSIQGSVFMGVPVNSVGISDTEMWCGVEFSGFPEWGEHQMFSEDELISNLDIKESSVVKDGVFSCAASITNVVFGESVCVIGAAAFKGCSGLRTVKFSSNLQSIGEQAFYGTKLKKVKIGKSVFIGADAFPADCVLIKPVVINVFGGSSESVYDGKSHGFDYRFIADDSTYNIDSIAVKVEGSKPINAGVYELLLSSNMFANVNEDCEVEFIVTQGEKSTLTILPAEVSQDGNEPWGGDGPRPYVGGEGVHSLYNTESTYDGFGHTIDVETLSGIKLVGGDVPQISYALTSNGVYQTEPIYFTNSCFTSIWYKVESPNHKPYIHEAGISILPRPVCVVSESAQKNYDGMPLTAHSFRVEGMGFVGSDGVELSYEGAQTWPGSSANDFSYRFKFNTRPENYDVVCEYGTLKVGAKGDVSIHAGETSIPENAFAGCVGITQVTIPESVTSIGANAFSGCVGLKKIAFPSKMVLRWSELRRIGLTDEFVRLTFASGDWLIANQTLLAYIGDPNVSELTVPNGIEIIDEEAFAGLYNLQKIHFCGTEKEIGPFAFRDCTYLDDVVLPDTVEVLGEGTFSGCSYIFDFDMGNGVREIGESAFEGCQTIENMVCSTNLLDVGSRAFADCYYLRDVALPLGVTNVATSAFAGCAALTGVTVPTHVAPLSRWFPEQYKSICSVTIPDDETEMVPSMFEGCQGLGIDPVDGAESIILPEGLTEIPDRAFADCSSIVQLTLPTGVVSIGEAAFERCQFVAFEMPDAVTTVGKGAFRGCSALKDVTLAKSLAAIPDELFAGCASLDSFTVPGCVAQLGANFVPYQTSAIYFMSNAPVYAANAYDSANVHELVNYVKRGTMGWNGQPTGRVLPTPAVWPANTVVPIKYWEANQFEAVFDGNGGYFASPAATTFACKETTFESYAIPPYDPVRPGYAFMGWWTDPTGGSRIRSTTRVTLTKPNDEVQTIYAHWKKGEAKWVTIRFNAMGGTVSPAFTNCIVGEIYGNALKSVVPTKEYYDFYGWYTMAYWPDGELQTAETIVPDADRELFARWEPKTYIVRYHANGGTGTMGDGSFVYGDKFNLAANQFKRAGHAFAGWASTADGAKKYNDGAELSDFGAIEDGVVDLYAVWVAVDCYYSIRFDSNGGVGTMTNQTVRIGDTVPLDPNRFTRMGYAFVGWALRADDYEKVYDDQESVCNLSETDGDTVALFAVWVKAEGEEASNVLLVSGGARPWRNVPGAVVVGSGANVSIYQSSWQSGAIGDGEATVLATTVNGEGKIGFWWKVSCEKYKSLKLDNLEFSIDGTAKEPWINGETDWVYLEFEVEGSGDHVLRWTYSKDEEDKDGQDCGWVTGIRWTRKLSSLADYLNCDNLEFVTSGDANWQPDLVTTHDGVASLRSGVIGDGRVSRLETVVAGNGIISFWWNASSESYKSALIDKLTFLIDGVEIEEIGSTSATWAHVTKEVVGAGSHTLTWVYSKDEADAQGEDCGWLDEVSWTPVQKGAVVPSEITGEKEIVVDESWPASLDVQFGAGTSAAFVEKFGSNLSAALLKSTGKKSAAGKEEMYVWQDYVAGTDPTDPKSQFTAKIEMVDGEPVVIWSPKLSEAEAAKRVYTTYGKKTLEAGEPWTPVEMPAQGGWRFFKVGVEMR